MREKIEKIIGNKFNGVVSVTKNGEILDLDLKEISPEITVRQLLNHTSGIPDYFDEEIMDEYADLWVNFPNCRVRESADLLPLFIDKPMQSAPDECFKYNNTGYVVLGLVIAKGTGAGGVFTTAEDVEKFWAGLGKILSEKTVAAMTSRQIADNDDDDDYGFWLTDGVPYFQGCDPGVSFISSRDAGGLFVCVISNFGDSVWEIHEKIWEAVG